MGHACAGLARDDVAGAHLQLLALDAVRDLNRRRPQLEHRAACEEDEQLLVGRVAVRPRTRASRFEPPPVDACMYRAGLPRETHPAAGVAFVRGLGVAEVDRAWRCRLARVER